jgi:hypothetical protein
MYPNGRPLEEGEEEEEEEEEEKDLSGAVDSFSNQNVVCNSCFRLHVFIISYFLCNPFSGDFKFNSCSPKYKIYHHCIQETMTHHSTWCCNLLRNLRTSCKAWNRCVNYEKLRFHNTTIRPSI